MLLGFLKSRLALAGIAAVLLALIGVYVVADSRGAARARAECLAKELAEKQRQDAANDEAREINRGRALTMIEGERRTSEILEEILNASPSPDPHRCGLGSDRVRRLNRLR